MTDDEDEAGPSSARPPPANPNDEFDFEKYDEEDSGWSGVVSYLFSF